MALTTAKEVDGYPDQQLRSFKIASATTVFKGGFVGLKSDGCARGLVAGDPFAGVAYESADNSTGSDGDISGRIYTTGDFEHTLTGATIASRGRPVFASADATLTFVGHGNSYVGTAIDVPSTGTIILRIDPAGRLVKSVVHQVEDLGAGADIAARAIHSFDSEGWITAIRIVNQASAAAGIDAGNTCVVTVAIDAGTVASETFDNVTTFPAENTVHDFGAPANAHAYAGNVMTISVQNGATANPGPFLVEVDYV